jgi:hypothetical protein
MQIMKKTLLLAAFLALPLATFAADAKPAAGHAAAAPAPAASAISSREAVQASKQRGSAMGACQQKATDQKLTGEERKTFIATCVKA